MPCVRHLARCARSVFGIVDLLALLPTYLAIFVPALAALPALNDVRVLRLVSLFRVLESGACVAEFAALGQARAVSCRAAPRRKIMGFMAFVMLLLGVSVMGTLTYVVEGRANGQRSILVGIYRVIITMTTASFGGIPPKTDLRRVIPSVMMLIGWGTRAVPTGIAGAEFSARRIRHEPTMRTCFEERQSVHNFCVRSPPPKTLAAGRACRAHTASCPGRRGEFLALSVAVAPVGQDRFVRSDGRRATRRSTRPTVSQVGCQPKAAESDALRLLPWNATRLAGEFRQANRKR